MGLSFSYQCWSARRKNPEPPVASTRIGAILIPVQFVRPGHPTEAPVVAKQAHRAGVSVITGRAVAFPSTAAFLDSSPPRPYSHIRVTGTPIDPGTFVASVQPLLERKDLEGLLCVLKKNWSPDQITSLLCSPHEDARKIAALSLSLVGRKCNVPSLVECLKSKDLMTNQMAEHALWSIWFRCGCTTANTELARGAQCLEDREFDCAFEHFNKALELSPDFAEAYNQRAITHYLMENYEESLKDCQRAVDLMPHHFGAWAGMGHCHAHLGQKQKAIDCYVKALSINPNLDCLHQAVAELRKQLNQN